MKQTIAKRIKISKLGLVYMISMVLAELHQAGLFGSYYLTAILIGLFWFFAGLIVFLLRPCCRQTANTFGIVMLLLLLPWAVFFLHNVLIYAFGIAYQPFLKSSFVQILFTPCILLGAFGSFYLFKKNTLRYFLYSVLFTYVITLVHLFISKGAAAFFAGIATLFTGNSVGNPFEANSDLVLALGLLVIFYLDSFIWKRVCKKRYVFLLVLLVLLGGKRIEMMALVIIFALRLCASFWTEKKKYQIQLFLSIAITAGLFLFVYLVVNGSLSNFAYSHGINAMGRLQMWDYVAQYVRFSPFYLGNGYSFSNLLLERDQVWTYKNIVYVLHSDVLKVFFDLGFPMFTFWTVYNLFVLPYQFRRRFGYPVSNLVWYLTAYLFVLYLTDNAINYFIIQTVFVLLIMQAVSYPFPQKAASLPSSEIEGQLGLPDSSEKSV
jgi:hypothetical protein